MWTAIAVAAALHLSAHEQAFERVKAGEAPESYAIALPRSTTPNVKKLVFGWMPTFSSASSLHWDLLTHVAWFANSCSAAGAYRGSSAWPNTQLVNSAHAAGVKVQLSVTCFSTASIHASVSNAQAFADALANDMAAGNADGVDLDFEGLPHADRDAFTTLVQLIATAVKAKNPAAEVSLAMPAVNWGGNYDLTGIANAADQLVIMGYDYHWGGDSQAGPVAPLLDGSPWNGAGISVTKSVDAYLSAGVPAAKLLLAVPYYGYEWQTDATTIPANATSTGVAKLYKNIDVTTAPPLWDTGSQTPYFVDASAPSQLWFDDADSLAMKYDLVNQRGIAGIGIWALGYDGTRPELWDLIHNRFGVDGDGGGSWDAGQFDAGSGGTLTLEGVLCEGSVPDDCKSTRTPLAPRLAGATVQIGAATFTTDASGWYYDHNAALGATVTIVASAPGHITTSRTVSIPSSGTIAYGSVALPACVGACPVASNDAGSNPGFVPDSGTVHAGGPPQTGGATAKPAPGMCGCTQADASVLWPIALAMALLAVRRRLSR